MPVAISALVYFAYLFTSRSVVVETQPGNP